MAGRCGQVEGTDDSQQDASPSAESLQAKSKLQDLLNLTLTIHPDPWTMEDTHHSNANVWWPSLGAVD